MEILEQDETSPLNDDELDHRLWLVLFERISTPKDLHQFRQPVAVYYASRLMQFEVGNGGFAQAAFNIPEWFELAAAAYDSLGKNKAGKLSAK